jgi:Tat protein secretion system quality control protein TatD with DNase activity
MVETDAPYMRGDKAYYPISDTDTQSENTEGRGGGGEEGVKEEGGRDEVLKLLRAGQVLSENSPKADLVSHIRKLESALRREIQTAGMSEERRGDGCGGGSASGLRAAPRPDVLIRNKKKKPRRDTEPADVVAVVRCLSELMGFPPHQVAKQTTANAARFFQLDIPARHPNKPWSATS